MSLLLKGDGCMNAVRVAGGFHACEPSDGGWGPSSAARVLHHGANEPWDELVLSIAVSFRFGFFA